MLSAQLAPRRLREQTLFRHTGDPTPTTYRKCQFKRTLSGLFLVSALNRPRKRKRTNQENPRTIPEQIGKIPEKRTKKDKKGRTSPDRETPPFETPPARLAALDIQPLNRWVLTEKRTRKP